MRIGRLKETITFPVRQAQVEDELLKFLAAQPRPIEPDKVYGPLADRCGLSSVHRAVPRRNRSEPAWNNLVQQARRRLVDLGFIEKLPPKGLWSLTAAGRKRAQHLERGTVKSIDEDILAAT